jgi:hypothetical protein
MGFFEQSKDTLRIGRKIRTNATLLPEAALRLQCSAPGPSNQMMIQFQRSQSKADILHRARN